MDLPTPSPKHIIPNHPFYFFAFGKKLVDGKNEYGRNGQLQSMVNYSQSVTVIHGVISSVKGGLTLKFELITEQP